MNNLKQADIRKFIRFPTSDNENAIERGSNYDFQADKEEESLSIDFHCKTTGLILHGQATNEITEVFLIQISHIQSISQNFMEHLYKNCEYIILFDPYDSYKLESQKEKDLQESHRFEKNDNLSNTLFLHLKNQLQLKGIDFCEGVLSHQVSQYITDLIRENKSLDEV